MHQSESFIAGPFDAERLDVYRVARELLAEVAAVSRGWRGQAELVDQARRAALSCLLRGLIEISWRERGRKKVDDGRAGLE